MWKEFLRDEAGQDVVEYALLMTLIAAAAILVLTGLGTSVTRLFQKLTDLFDSVQVP